MSRMRVQANGRATGRQRHAVMFRAEQHVDGGAEGLASERRAAWPNPATIGCIWPTAISCSRAPITQDQPCNEEYGRDSPHRGLSCAMPQSSCNNRTTEKFPSCPIFARLFRSRTT